MYSIYCLLLNDFVRGFVQMSNDFLSSYIATSRVLICTEPNRYNLHFFQDTPQYNHGSLIWCSRINTEVSNNRSSWFCKLMLFRIPTAAKGEWESMYWIGQRIFPMKFGPYERTFFNNLVQFMPLYFMDTYCLQHTFFDDVMKLVYIINNAEINRSIRL